MFWLSGVKSGGGGGGDKDHCGEVRHNAYEQEDAWWRGVRWSIRWMEQ